MSEKFTAVRVASATFERYQAFAARYEGISASAMVDMVLNQIADLIDAPPEKRHQPRFMQVLDLAPVHKPFVTARPAPSKPAPARN